MDHTFTNPLESDSHVCLQQDVCKCQHCNTVCNRSPSTHDEYTTTVKIIGRRNITDYNKQLAIHNMIAHNQVHLQKIIKIMLPGSLDCLIFGFSHVDLDDNGCCILSKIRCGHCYTHICESCHFINM